MPRHALGTSHARDPEAAPGAAYTGSVGRDGARDLLDRRELLRRAAAAGIGFGALAIGCGEGSEPAATRAGGGAVTPAAGANGARGTRVLGRTGLEVSDIGFGSGGVSDPELLRYAFDRGVRSFDTAESYPLGRPGRAERAIGEAFRGRFDRIVLTTKTEARATDTRHTLMRRLERSLRRLGTDHVDVYLNHAVNDLARLRNPEWFEFVENAKRTGKIRFSGMSGHAGRLIACLDAALEEDLVDVILAAYNFGEDPRFYEGLTRDLDVVALQPELPRVLARAHAKGVGVLVMKTLRGAKLNDLGPYEEEGGSFAQAALRWVLANPDVDALVISMDDRRRIDEYLGASGAVALRPGDREILERYARRTSDRYCRPACDACTGSCPHGVPIPDVLRARMYAEDYGDPARGRGAHAGLDVDASACLTCSGAPCRGACPHGLDLATRVRDTPRLLARG